TRPPRPTRFPYTTLFRSSAQTISGQVTDQETGEALEFVNVGVLNRNIGTVTDEQGNFSLPLSPKNDADTLRISLIGYEPASFVRSEEHTSELQSRENLVC